MIEDRWHLEEGEGAAQLFVGALTKNMMGGGFLYTNKESISLGLVIGLEQLSRRGDEVQSWQLLDEFKKLAPIRSLVAGGTAVEYSAHAIAEGGISQVPQLFGDGYLLAGDTAGLSLNALFTVPRDGLRDRERVPRRANRRAILAVWRYVRGRSRWLRITPSTKFRPSRPRGEQGDSSSHGKSSPVLALPWRSLQALDRPVLRRP